MAEIVNLRRAKKAKARAEKETRASENRAKFGASKASKDLKAARETLERRKIDAHKRDDQA